MKMYYPLLLSVFLLTVQPAFAVRSEGGVAQEKNCATQGKKMDCEGGARWCNNEKSSCSPEMRGRCGKRRGDWYGASQPVPSAEDARKLLVNYFADREYTVSGMTEKKWGFRADILDRNGVVIDRVMIDKRSGRIRSLN